MHKSPTSLWRALAMGLALVLGAGCASTHNDPADPFEGYNRAMFAFNDRLDKAVLRPTAQVYDTLAPLPVRAGVGNFFANIDDLWTGVNNLLQGKLREGLTDFSRVAVNTTVGILGVFDIATEMGLERHDEDFGQTLGRWGVGEGPFVVLPLFGPRTLRDAGGFVVDTHATGSWLGRDPAVRNGSSLLRLVNTRANFLAADRVLDEGAIDRYNYVREAYLQRRRYEVHDGRPPRDPEFDDLSGVEPGLSSPSSMMVALAAVVRIEFAGAGAAPGGNSSGD